MNKLYRVFRKKEHVVPSFLLEFEANECFVLASNNIRAKGIAKVECPALFEGLTNKDILVEEVDMTKERMICRR